MWGGGFRLDRAPATYIILLDRILFPPPRTWAVSPPTFLAKIALTLGFMALSRPVPPNTIRRGLESCRRLPTASNHDQNQAIPPQSNHAEFEKRGNVGLVFNWRNLLYSLRVGCQRGMPRKNLEPQQVSCLHSPCDAPIGQCRPSGTLAYAGECRARPSSMRLR